MLYAKRILDPHIHDLLRDCKNLVKDMILIMRKMVLLRLMDKEKKNQGEQMHRATWNNGERICVLILLHFNFFHSMSYSWMTYIAEILGST